MAQVTFPDSLLGLTGETREIEVPAASYRELVLALDERFTGLGEALDKMAVAIDGQIYQDAFLEPLQANAEVFFMQRIEGG